MIVIGIDPGVTGAICFYDPTQPNQCDVYDLPAVAGVIDGRNLATMIRVRQPDRAVIEMVASRPGEGVSSVFRFGRSYGTVIGVLEALGLSVSYVTPGKWKKFYSLDSDGENSRRRALDLFPAAAASFSRKKDHNRAEAALIARWGVEAKAAE